MFDKYKVVKDENNVLHFTADSGLRYFARLLHSPHLSGYPYEDFIYEFSFELTTPRDKFTLDYDSKVSNTIAYLASQFFEQLPVGIMLFVCESTDGLHRHRKITFEKYFVTI